MSEGRSIIQSLNGSAYRVTISGDGPPLLLLHGFTGSAESWAEIMPQLIARWRVLAPDLLGHGGSDAPADPPRLGMQPQVADLIALLDLLQLPSARVLGYSMGGRVALSLAIAAPDRVERLVLESASPGLADPTERAVRIAADEALADRIERDGLAAFVAYWEGLALFASQAALPAATRARHRAQRLRGSPHGLAQSLRGLGTGRMPPLWDQLGALRVPTLLLAGDLDTKYTQIARQMVERLPNAQLRIVAGVGHTIHLERPVNYVNLVADFLRE